MPGVVVTTAVRTGPNTVTAAPSSTYFVVGTAERGPIDAAQVVNSLAEFEVYYGGYTSDGTLHEHLQTFFEEGGSRAYVGRVVGGGASAGVGTSGTLTVTAANPGAWCNAAPPQSGLEFAVVASGSGFRFQLILNGETVYTSPVVSTQGELVAATSTSNVAKAYATVSTSNAAGALSPVSATALSGGANGSNPSTSDLVTALDLFDASLGSGAVAIPSNYGTTIYDGLIAHAVATNRIALLGTDPSYTSAALAITNLDLYIGTAENGEYAAMYFPYVNIVNATGTAQSISPESFVAAKRAKAHNEVGPWKVGAGLQSKANFVTGTAVAVDKAAGAALDDAQINAIRVIQNSVRIYGARSLSDDQINFRFINSRDMLNYIVSESETRLEDLLFAPIDGRRAVFGQVESTLIALLDPLRTAGGLFEAFDADGNRIDSGYSVEVTDALNPLAQLADGVVRAKVGVRISSISDKIEIEIVKSNLTSSVV